MTKLKLYLLFLSFGLLGNPIYMHSQKKDKNAVPRTEYDSLSNFLGKEVAAYTGQTLILKALPSGAKSYGYPGFILKYQKDKELINDAKNIYKCCDGYNSKYEDIVGKKYRVLEVVKHPQVKNEETMFADDFYLHLEDISNGEKVYFKYNIDSEYTFPFLTLGYYEKQKQLYIGKKYVFANEITTNMRGLKNGKTIVNNLPSQKWKCIDITIDSESNDMLLVIEGDKGYKSSIPFSEIVDNTEVRKIYTDIDADFYIKKFNINNFNRILQRKIRVGMTSEMCQMAWGNPLSMEERISGKSKIAIWTYPAGVVSFRLDKIISIK